MAAQGSPAVMVVSSSEHECRKMRRCCRDTVNRWETSVPFRCFGKMPGWQISSLSS